MQGTAKPLNLSQPFLISALIAEIARLHPRASLSNAQFSAIVEAANHVVIAFSRDSGDA
ncbi:hypothetical protein U9K49_22850 (plasmid) [Pantoea agglomerans]|uniref:hypothetical protein n=1 Tax=Enterobacter agglomerans TaxID=549 RepID=UPI002D775E75|nr:hypothetical protein [Pantoea agglomerans]WRO92881.1 hypothetical protein U9K49_22850 [Pantoea agglomerans]